jgi:hypothetical protein
VHWHVGNKIEWSVDLETEFFIKSFGCDLFSFVLIDNLPSLVSIVGSTIDSDCLTFLVLASSNIKALFVLNVAEVFVFIDKDLEPLRVGAPDLHVDGSS